MKFSAVIAALVLLTLPIIPLPSSGRNASLALAAASPETSLAGQETRARYANGDPKSTAGGLAVESLIPQLDLQFYVDIHGDSAIDLLKSAVALTSSAAATELDGISVSQLSRFVAGHLNSLTSNRIVIAGFSGGGAAAILEASDAPHATEMALELEKLFSKAPAPSPTGVMDAANADTPIPTAKLPRPKPRAAVMDRFLIAGTERAVDTIKEPYDSPKLDKDEEFRKVRAKFSGDQFFAYVKLTGALPLATNPAAQNSSYWSGVLTATQGMPGWVALGGSMQGGTASIHGQFGSSPGGGMLSSILYSGKTTPPQAAGFMLQDTDVFIDVSLDWEKLYNTMAPLFNMFAGSIASQGVEATPASLQQRLGFSIKDDLLPTLGNELALSFRMPRPAAMPGPAAGADKTSQSHPTGFSSSKELPAGFVSSRELSQDAPVKLSVPRFSLALAIKDPVKFEQLLSKILNGPAASAYETRPASNVVTVTYRGMSIKSVKGFSFTILDGFLVLAGSVADIRRVLDERAAGRTLAASQDFLLSVGQPQPALFQVYVSSTASRDLMQRVLPKSEHYGASSSLGLTISPGADGTVLNARIPTRLALEAIASAMNSMPKPFGISPSSATINSNGRINGKPVPKMSSDDGN
jgi:hypothetical protein